MEYKNRVKIKILKTRWDTLELYNGSSHIGEIDKEKLLEFLGDNIKDMELFEKIG